MKAALGPYSNLVNFYQSRLAMIFFFGGVQRILCLRCVPSLSHSLGVTPIHSCPERLCKNKMHHCVHSILCSVLYCIENKHFSVRRYHGGTKRYWDKVFWKWTVHIWFSLENKQFPCRFCRSTWHPWCFVGLKRRSTIVT